MHHTRKSAHIPNLAFKSHVGSCSWLDQHSKVLQAKTVICVLHFDLRSALATCISRCQCEQKGQGRDPFRLQSSCSIPRTQNVAIRIPESHLINISNTIRILPYRSMYGYMRNKRIVRRCCNWLVNGVLWSNSPEQVRIAPIFSRSLEEIDSKYCTSTD